MVPPSASSSPPRPFPETSRLEVLYSGNFGLPHDAETIAGAMSRLTDPARFRFVFAGGGSRRASLEDHCRAAGVRNASFLPYQHEARMADHLGNCHIGLVTQDARTCGALVPSKTYGLMAAGRPFLFVGPPDATPARIADRYRCGWHVPPGDVSSLTALLERLAVNPDLLREAGARARDACLNFYHRDAGVSRILKILTAGCLPHAEAVPDNQHAVTV